MSSTARRVASGSVLGVVDFVAAAVVSFFMMPFVVRSLGDRMYGFWTFVGAFLGYYGLLDFGLSSAVMRHIAGAIGAKDHEESNRVFSTALILYAGLGALVLVASVVLATLAPVLCRNRSDASAFWKIMLILGAQAAISFPARTFGGILRAQLRYDIIALIGLFSMILRTSLVVLVLVSGHKLLALAWVTFISSIPKDLLYVYFSKKNLPSLRLRREYWKLRTAKVLFSYSSFAFIAQLANQLQFNMNALVITAFLRLSLVTHYNVAATLVHYFIGFVTAFMAILQPLFSRQHGARENQAIRETFFLATKISVWVSSFVAFGLIAWGKPFVERWMGPDYLDCYPCLVFLVIGSVTGLWQIPSVNLLYGISKHRVYAVLVLAEGISNLLLSIILVRRFGIAGVAFGMFLPMVVMKLSVQPIYVCRTLSIRYTEYARVVGKSLFYVGVSLIIPALLSLGYAAPDYMALMLIGLSSAVCYSVGMVLVAFNREEKRSVLQAIWPRLRFGKSGSRAIS